VSAPHKQMPRALYFTIGVYPGGKTRAAAEVRAQQNLAALHALGYDITVATPRDPHGRDGIGHPVVWLDAQPAEVIADFLRNRVYRAKIRTEIGRLLHDHETLLFCEHFWALACCPPHRRMVYSCHDFIVQTIRLRGQLRGRPVTLKTRLYWRYLEWIERRLMSEASSIICVSASEAERVRTNLKIRSEYIPIVPVGEPPAPEITLNPAVRCWFYGGSGATSNKIMLEHLVRVLFELLRKAMPQAEFHQAGSYNTYAPERVEWLQKNFTVHGFVDEPAALFQRGDFCLIPYEFDTGFRTKIPEICGLGMIAAGYHSTFACCPEMRDGYNCVIAESPQALADKLAIVAADAAKREQLANGSIETRRREFSHAVLLERYQRALGCEA